MKHQTRAGQPKHGGHGEQVRHGQQPGHGEHSGHGEQARHANRRGRLGRIVLSVVLVATGLQIVDLAVPAWACACGAPAPRANDPMGDVMIGSEYAIISITDQREQIDMRLSVETVAQDSGLIFPTPEPATVSLGDEADFDAITSQMRPREVVHYDFWYLPFPGAAGPNGEGGAGAPVILSEVQLGPLRATTLAASDSDGLTAWLEDNGFMVRDEVEPLLRQYITKGWYFVALSLTNPDGLGGDLAPISFSFDLPADGPVYPLALSRAARIEQQVNLYVFADHQYDVAWEDPSAGDTLRSWPVWSGPVDQPTLERFGGWMTAFHLDFWDPAENIADDIAFYQASADEEIGTVYETVQPVTVFGIIGLGWVLIPAGLWLLAGLITLLARLFGRLINS